MAAHALEREDLAGLAVAAALHAGLLALLVLHPSKAPLVAPPDPINVTLSDDAGLTSTSPQPQPAPAADQAPVRGEEPATMPEPAPIERAVPVPPTPAARPLPVVRAQPATPRAQPDIIGEIASRPPAHRAIPRPGPARPGGASTIGSDFLKGLPNAASGPSHGAPAAAIGPAVRNSLAGAISRQLKPHWAAPQGADAEKLITVLSFDLNPDGSLAGPPRLVNQEGINELNRPQAARHAEQAKRAVQLAAPFALPPEFYPAWKHVASFRFDRRLSQ